MIVSQLIQISMDTESGKEYVYFINESLGKTKYTTKYYWYHEEDEFIKNCRD